MDIKKIQGLRTKTISVFTSASTTKFNLQNNNELGLPDDAVIFAIQARTPDSAKGTTPTGAAMVNTTVFNASYLFLKVRDKNGKIDLLTQAYYMPFLVTTSLFLDPSKSCNIDWNESYIQINESAKASVNVLESYEIMVHYFVDCPFIENPHTLVHNKLEFRTGQTELGTRRARFELSLTPNIPIYRLSNTENIGLPLDAVLIGFDVQQPAITLKNGTKITDALKSAFLTIKKGTNAFIDAYPMEKIQTKDSLIDGLDYFPIDPVQVNQLDWNSSFIQIFKSNLILSGELLSIELIWKKNQ